jgi:hypothetical protein
MATFGGALGTADFQEPNSPDQTSAPQMPDQPALPQALAQALARRKKKGSVGPSVKPPSTLAAAISKSKRAMPGRAKFG